MSATYKITSADNPKARSSLKTSELGENNLNVEAEAVDLKTPLMMESKEEKPPFKESSESDEKNTTSDQNVSDRNGKSSDESDGTVRITKSFPNENGSHHHQHDIDIVSILEEIPDLNVYQHKKTLAQGMMDLALFSANANQLRYVLDSYERHPYYYPSLIFIIFSLILQVAIGVLLIWNATYNVKDKKEVCRANRINNYTVIGIFLVTVINVFISAFGVADPLDMITSVPSVPTSNSTRT